MRFKPVVTLKNAGFQVACKELAKLTTGEQTPDLICGILTGGDVVARAMMETGQYPDCTYVAVKLQRPGTKVKRKLRFDAMLRLLPMRVNDMLRVLEDYCRESRFAKRSPETVVKGKVDFPADIRSKLKDSKNILIVDDAVDSGLTLHSVIECIRDIAPNAIIRSAAISLTFANPLVRPNFVLYQQTLVRFPWSSDARE